MYYFLIDDWAYFSKNKYLAHVPCAADLEAVLKDFSGLCSLGKGMYSPGVAFTPVYQFNFQTEGEEQEDPLFTSSSGLF